MALFKILRGQSTELDNQPFHDGYAYFTPDDGRFYIDVQSDTALEYYYNKGTENGKTVYRIEIESKTWSELINTKAVVGHKHDISDIGNIKSLKLSGGTSTFTYNGLAEINIDLRPDWAQTNENSIDFIKNKPTIHNIGITIEDDEKTMYIQDPINNGDGVSY